MLKLLERCTTSSQQDKMKWGSSKSGMYSVKAGYADMCSNNMLINLWTWKLVWKTTLPSKVCWFSWFILSDACLMRDNLSKRGLQLDNKCFICQSNSESINHLFLHCPVASDIWHMFFNIFGLYCAMPFSVRDAYVSWRLKETWQFHQENLENGTC